MASHWLVSYWFPKDRYFSLLKNLNKIEEYGPMMRLRKKRSVQLLMNSQNQETVEITMELLSMASRGMNTLLHV